MTYAAERKRIGRQPLIVAELVLDYCANTYGEAPCTASGAAGAECYNCFATCQDTANFSLTTKTYRFCEQNADLPAGFQAFPCIESVSLAPTKIEPNGLGQRASVTLTLRDFPHHDRGIDPYASTRSYDPETTGSFFGKLKSRNPYYVNRILKIKVGYIAEAGLNTDLTTDFQTRTYFIERFEGPDSRGQFRIIAKDILKLASNNSAQAPLPSDGVLNADITDVATSLVLKAGYTSTYASSGKVRIGDEIISYSGKSSDTLTGLTRAQNGTTASAHEADDSVQVCVEYSEQRPCDIIEDLLTTYAGVDGAFIPTSDWQTENDKFLISNRLSAIISEPTSAQELLEEVFETSQVYIWWDDVDQEIKFKVSFPLNQRDIIQTVDDETGIVNNSMSVVDDAKLRLSEVDVYWDQISAVEDVKKTNFKKIYVLVDTEKEASEQFGQKATKEVLSRWITSQGQVVELAGRTLNQYKNTPKRIKFRTDAKDEFQIGQVVSITSRMIQDFTGASVATNFLVVSRDSIDYGSTYEYEATELGLGIRAGYIGPDTLNDYDVESETNRNLYGFISGNDGLMSDGSGAYKIA